MGFMRPKVPRIVPPRVETPPARPLEPTAPRPAATTDATATGPAAAQALGFNPNLVLMGRRRESTAPRRTLLGG